MGRTKIECKKLESLTETQKCVFCSTSDLDEMKYGPVYMNKNIITHYYCLLLSSNMEQNGRDSEGILGFLPSDITKEVRRGVRLYCSFCRSGGATLGCAVAKCKVVFHLPCGMKHGTLHQFFGEFKSYCAKHRPVQRISEKILAESSKGGAMCGICHEKVVPRPIHETLWAPCCKKSAFFHRDCVQKLASSAGYFFKCPLCNNTEIFQQAMKDFGIYIPEQDASWECVPNAYQDLLVRHETCDSVNCSCPNGRKTNISGTRWELILCKYCGSQGIHIGCGRLKWKAPEFECEICNTQSSAQTQQNDTRTGIGDRHRLSGVNRMATAHPSVSADREGEVDGYSSDDSARVTISNRRKRVVTPPPEPRPKTSPPKRKTQEGSNKSSVDNTIVIEDSDEEVEVVSDTKPNSSWLKTLDGSTIPVVQLNSRSQPKRLRVDGDVKVLPYEMVDCIYPTKKPKVSSPPPIKELVYSLPTPQPSTSTIHSAPSTSFAPPPDLNGFVLVDPANFRPEDLAPGTLLYRSVQPMNQIQQQPQSHPQMQSQVPQMQSQVPHNVPMQQLGAHSRNANAKYPDLSKHRARGSHHFNSIHLQKCIKKMSRSTKRNSNRRRGRGRSDLDRLSPQVMLSPLKCRISSDGHVEILLPRKNLGFNSMKTKVCTLQSKKHHGTNQEKKPKKRIFSDILPCNELEPQKKKKRKMCESENKVVTACPTSNTDGKRSITYFFSTAKVKSSRKRLQTSVAKLEKDNVKNKADKQRLKKGINQNNVTGTEESTYPNSSPESLDHPKKRVRKKYLHIPDDWKYRKMDEYLKSFNKDTILESGKKESRLDSFSDQENEQMIIIKNKLGEIVDEVVSSVKQEKKVLDTSYESPKNLVPNELIEFVSNSPENHYCAYDTSLLPAQCNESNFQKNTDNIISSKDKEGEIDSMNNTHSDLLPENISMKHDTSVENSAVCNKEKSLISCTVSNVTDVKKNIQNQPYLEDCNSVTGVSCNEMHLPSRCDSAKQEESNHLPNLTRDDKDCHTQLPKTSPNESIYTKGNRKHNNPSLGLFPRIKFSHPNKVRQNQDKSKKTKTILTNTNIDSVRFRFNDVQDKKLKYNKAETCKTFSPNTLNKNMSIDSYFSPMKNINKPENQLICKCDPENSCLEVKKEKLFDALPVMIDNSGLVEYIERTNSPAKSPLVELQLNIISNFC